VDNALYEKKVTCPVCKNEISVTKVKIKSIRIVSRDTDLCVNYEGVNPLLYEPIVCESCGYATLSDKFGEINAREIMNVRTQITSRWIKHSYAGERDIDKAIEAYKITLLNYQARDMNPSDIAKVCIRIAWLYRLKKDEKEKHFLQCALDAYNDTYYRETFSSGKLDEATCMYMIAELNRRLGNNSESIKWFSRLISSPEAKKNKALVEQARDIFMSMKEKMIKPEA